VSCKKNESMLGSPPGCFDHALDTSIGTALTLTVPSKLDRTSLHVTGAVDVMGCLDFSGGPAPL
jgi:hypothetical protein